MLLLLLGGQRPAQLLRATVADVDLDARTLMLRDPKGKREQPRPHMLPLQTGAMEIVVRRITAAEALQKVRQEKMQGTAPATAASPTLLFTSHGAASVRLETLSVRVSEIAAAMVKAKEARAAFQLRDVRRTAETMLASVGISRDIRAQLLSHGISGVQAAHYDRHDYMAEKSNALRAWESRLRELATGGSAESNVRWLNRA
jgi:integrase